MAVCASDRPVHQAMTYSQTGELAPVWPDLLETNSQNAPRYTFGNGSTYAAYLPAFLKEKTLYGARLRGYEMPMSRSVDLDDEDDLLLLQYFAERMGPLTQ